MPQRQHYQDLEGREFVFNHHPYHQEEISHLSEPTHLYQLQSPNSAKSPRRKSRNPLGFLKKIKQRKTSYRNIYNSRNPNATRNNEFTDTIREDTALLLGPPAHISFNHDDDDALLVFEADKSPTRVLDIEKQIPAVKRRWAKLRKAVKRGDYLLQKKESLEEEAREALAEQKVQEIRSHLDFGLWHCVLAILFYLIITILCYNFLLEPEWSLLDSCYFAVSTFTTVGYGDEVPTTETSMLFTSFYAFTGVACLGIALGVIGSNLLDAQDKAIQQADRLLQNQVLSLFDRDAADCTAKDKNQPRQQPQKLFYCGPLPLLILLIGLAFFIGHLSGWDSKETLYYLVVTASTVGYGDFAPKTDTAKIVAIFFIPLAVGCMGEWLGLVANWIMQKQMSKFHKHYMTEGLSQTDLDIMDKDGDGEVTRAEFLEFMLVAMHKMDSDLVETLRKHFDRLDVDGTGILDRADLIHQARQQLKTSEHKMELLAYKQKLLGTTRTETTLQGLPAQWTNTLWKVGAGGKNP